jgi:lambda repressor-like predicted transcriptional regulator
MGLFSTLKTLYKLSKTPEILGKIETLTDIFAKSHENAETVVKVAIDTQKRHILDSLFEETQTKTLSEAFLAKLVETARAGIVIEMNINGAPVKIKRDDAPQRSQMDNFASQIGLQPPPPNFRAKELR